MTKILFLAMLIATLMACSTASETSVRVHIEGTGTGKTKLVTADSIYTMELDSLKSVLFVLANNQKPGYAEFQLGRVAVPVYIEPGKSFDLSLRFEGRKAIPFFTGDGAKKNEYINSEIMKFRPDFKLDEDAFIVVLDEQYNKALKELEKHGFDTEFNRLEKARLAAEIYGRMMSAYPSFHAYSAQLKDFTPTDNFYAKLKSLMPVEPALMELQNYKSALVTTVQTLGRRDVENLDPMTFVKSELDYTEKNISDPTISEYLVDEFISSYINRKGLEDAEELIAIYNTKVADPHKRAGFTKICDKWKRIQKGQPSSSFKYLDINGHEVALADLAGKYVYIDVWATWCGPCRAELPHLKELEHKYQKNNIAFVSISCDQDKVAWEKMVREEKLKGIQLHCGGDQSFLESYMITGIPRFILLDKEGKILNADMSRPSSPATVEAFDALEGI